MMRRILFLAGLLSGAVSADRLPAQEVPEGTILGVVTGANGEPVARALVEILDTDLSSVTDDGGRFAIREIPTGVYSLRAGALGYRPVLLSNQIVGSGKPLTVRIELPAQPFELEAIEVAPSFFAEERQERPANTRRLDAVDTRRTPGVIEDVVRSVSLLPGVAVPSPGRNDLAVRGGAPYESLFIVDGVEVPNINHFGSQGSTGGPLSLINIEFVRETEFASGGMGVRYGDRTASVTDIRLREGSTDGLAGTLNLSATGAGAILEGPIGSGGSFLFSARRSYLDLLFNAAGFSFVPSYWDFQLKTSHRLSDRDRLSFLFVGALDDITFNTEDEEDEYDNSRTIAPNVQQYFAGVTWDRLFGASRLEVTLGRTFTSFETTQTILGDPPQEILRNFSDEGENGLRVEWTTDPSRTLSWTLGNSLKYASDLTYDVQLAGEVRTDSAGIPRPLAVDTSFTAFRNATYAEAAVRATDRIRVTGGLRADWYDFIDDGFRLSPRLGATWQLGAGTSLRGSLGRYVQPPSYIWLIGDPLNPETLTPIVSDQATLGIERLLRPDLRLQFEGYYKRYEDYPARVFRPQAVLAPSGFEDATNDIPFGLEPLLSDGTGRSYGAELFLQKRLSEIPIYGLLSLSLGRAEYASLEGVDRPGTYDTRFIGSISTGWRINPKWEVSGKFRLATGLPTTPFITSGPDTGQRDWTQYNEGERFPTFHALDLRVDRRFSFRSWQLEVYLDVQNVYGRNNISAVRWDPRSNEPEFNESLGVLPTIGINVEF
ncbi:MAG: TonB-dependent receptor [marine benthic group bacterium]|nr:TonB-dependent receptor [Gemmatimonadota bacterium]